MDAVAPAESTIELYKQMAAAVGSGGAEFDVVDGVGHFGPLEAPERFATLLTTPMHALQV